MGYDSGLNSQHRRVTMKMTLSETIQVVIRLVSRQSVNVTSGVSCTQLWVDKSNEHFAIVGLLVTLDDSD